MDYTTLPESRENITTYCGLECTGCEWREPCRCGGCVATRGFAFHCKDEPCPVAQCAIGRDLTFCGDCHDFPCELLESYSCDPEHGDDPRGARIEHCRHMRWHLIDKAISSIRYAWIDEYLMQKPGVTKDLQQGWSWVRYKVGEKMFAAILLGENDAPYYINLKLEPLEGEFYRDLYSDVTPGYYSNKQHWNSIDPNGAVPDNLLHEMLDKSYQLVFSGLTKKKQKENMGE